MGCSWFKPANVVPAIAPRADSEPTNETKISIGVVGNVSVGKTALIRCLMKGKFNDAATSSHGISFESTTIDWNGSKCKVQFVDTAGSERFASVIWQPFRNVDAVMVCYDTTNPNSFEKLEYWVKECQQHLRDEAKIVVVGTKADEEAKRSVSASEAKRWAARREYSWIEGSSKSGTFTLEGILSLIQDKKVAEESTTTKNYYQYLNLEKVAGNHEAKEAMKRFFLQFEAPELYGDDDGDLSGAMLMYGPTGCGKTFLVKEAARTCGMKYIEVHPTDVTDKYHGESERKVKELFVEVVLKAPCIVFMDEFDAYCAKRGGGSEVDARTVNQILLGIDSCKNQSVLVVAATNRPEAIDAAIARRFSTRCYVRLLDAPGRQQVLRATLAHFPASQLQKLVDISAGLSGADIDDALKKARNVLRERLINATHVVPSGGHFYPCQPSDPGAIAKTKSHLKQLPLTFDLVDQALRNAPKSVSQQDIAKYDAYYNLKNR